MRLAKEAAEAKYGSKVRFSLSPSSTSSHTWIRNMPCRVKVKAKRKVPTHPSLKKMNPKIPNQRKAKVGKERVKLVNQTVWTMIQTLQWLRV